MLLIGAVAVGIGEIGSYLGSPALELLGLILVIGAAVVVAFAILYTTISSLRRKRHQGTTVSD